MAPLKRLCYATMGAVTLLGLILWPFSEIDPFDNEIIARTAAIALLLGLVSAALHLVLPALRPRIEMPWLRRATEVFPEAFELLLFYRWLPAAITVADYLVLPYSLPFADRALAWPEEAMGVPHWRTWPLFEASGLLPWLERVYASVDAQLLCMLLFFLLVKRDLHRLWEYTATVALAGSLSIVFLWAMPAVGPWAWYHDRYTQLPPEPGYLAELYALREGQLRDLEHVHGFLNFPSFHTVFALLIAWTLRGHGPLSVFAWTLNVMVVLSTVPVGWHYLTDVAGGALCTALCVWVVRRLQSR
jgi:membrane-associated phospholipid phosphatase